MNRKIFNAKWLAVIIVLLMSTAIIAGCGSSKGNNNSGSASMDMAQSKSSYISTTMGAEAPPAESAKQAAGDSDALPQLSEPGNLVLDSLNRKLIYTANVSMEVEDYAKAQSELFDLVNVSRGYMLNFSDNVTRYELGGQFVIKVPSGGFQSFLSQLEKMKHDKFQRNVQGQDVTEEYVDLTSRLKAKQVVESRLLGFMEKATDTKNLLEYSNALAKVQEEIETVMGRMRYLDQNVSYSTIELRMYEQLESKPGADKDANVLSRAGKAMKGSAEGIVAFFEGLLIVLAAMLPILIVLAIIAIPIVLRLRKAQSSRRQPISDQSPNMPRSYHTVVQTEEPERKDE